MDRASKERDSLKENVKNKTKKRTYTSKRQPKFLERLMPKEC